MLPNLVPKLFREVVAWKSKVNPDSFKLKVKQKFLNFANETNNKCKI